MIGRWPQKLRKAERTRLRNVMARLTDTEFEDLVEAERFRRNTEKAIGQFDPEPTFTTDKLMPVTPRETIRWSIKEK